MEYSKVIRLIGELEIIVAAAEPGLVITEGMSMVFSETLLKTVEKLKENI